MRHVVTALAVCVPLLAQNPAPPTPQGGPVPQSGDAAGQRHDDARVEQRAQQMRDTIDTGKPMQFHVRVAVRLKNGNKLSGVVKDGRLVERVDGLRFVEAQAKDRGAGIRLWYSSGARNYVFVPFADFAEYEVLQRLSQKQIEEMEHEMQMNERRAAERAGEAARKAATGGDVQGPPADTTPVGEAPPAPAQEIAPLGAAGAQQPAPGKAGAAPAATKDAATKDVATKDQEQQRQWFALLQAYPPAAGWGRQKRDEIARRFVVVGSKPSESELKFVDQFAEWEKACAHFGITAEAKAEGEGGKSGKTSKTARKTTDAEPKETPDSEAKPAAGEGEAATEGESAGKKRKKK